MDPVLSLPAEHKAIATGLTLAILWTAEHVAPAFSEGVGGWRHDLRNLALGTANALIVAGLLLWLAPWPAEGSGLLGWMGASVGVTLAVGLVALDLWMYAWHRLNHAVPFLWRFHRMHHADPSVDATTAVRFHPGEVLIGTAGRIPVALLLGLSAGHIVFYEAILLPVILFHHSNVRIPHWLDRGLGVVIVTPSLHRIHHSPARHETDSNFASVLSIWDRMARTRTALRGAAQPRYGLSEFDPARCERVTALLAMPFRRVARWAAPAAGEQR